jgi:hypothetical protein
MNETVFKTICPNCGSDELYLIGAVLRGKVGIKYTGDVKASLEEISPEILEGAVVCKNCKHQTGTNVLNALNDLQSGDCMWENTEFGTKLPIVCPICSNKKVFTKVILEQRTRAVTYAPDEQGVYRPQDQGLVLGDVEQLVVKYTCDVDNCNGVINLRDPDKYSLRRDHRDLATE